MREMRQMGERPKNYQSPWKRTHLIKQNQTNKKRGHNRPRRQNVNTSIEPDATAVGVPKPLWKTSSSKFTTLSDVPARKIPFLNENAKNTNHPKIPKIGSISTKIASFFFFSFCLSLFHQHIPPLCTFYVFEWCRRLVLQSVSSTPPFGRCDLRPMY